MEKRRSLTPKEGRREKEKCPATSGHFRSREPSLQNTTQIYPVANGRDFHLVRVYVYKKVITGEELVRK